MAIATLQYPLAHVSYDTAEIDAVVSTLRAGRTTCGLEVRAFEERFAEYVGRDHAIMVNSGSTADLLIAFGLGPAEPGDEILVPAVTWPTQVWACVMAGYTVRLVDADPDTLQMDIEDLARKVNSRTKGIFLTHILGNVGDLQPIEDLSVGMSIPLLEDCCEAMGSRWGGRHVGTFGRAAAFSFFFSHLLNTMEGGMVVTDSPDDDRLFRLRRSHGWEPREDYRFWFPTWGMNVRPTEVQGAFGNVQMDRIDGFLAARTINYRRLAEVTYEMWPEYLRGVDVHPKAEPAWHGFPLIVDPDAPFSKTELCAYLDEHGVETRPLVAGNLARQPATAHHPKVITGQLPGADLLHDSAFYIGVSSFDDTDGPAYVGDVVERFMRSHT